MNQLDKIKNRIKNLQQNKHLTDEQLNVIAEKQLQEEEILNSLTFCVNDLEKKYAKKLLENYLFENTIETFADKETFRLLIDYEILNRRIKEELKKEYSKANPTIPMKLVEEMENIGNQILILKEKLGFVRKDREEKSSYSIIEDLKNRFKKWINMPDNRANYTLACPKCEELILIRRRIDKEKDEVKQHPWYREGGLLFNKEIFIDINDKKITKEQAARYLDCSVDYIDWILNNYPISEDKIEEDV